MPAAACMLAANWSETADRQAFAADNRHDPAKPDALPHRSLDKGHSDFRHMGELMLLWSDQHRWEPVPHPKMQTG
ncbi:MAG: hypothetical protein KDJ66_16525, partial [Nitratireductor sp.]|nr:hypothetical protein [Nitratireductor sp.]